MATEAARRAAETVIRAWEATFAQKATRPSILLVERTALRLLVADALDAHADTATQAERARIEAVLADFRRSMEPMLLEAILERIAAKEG